MIDTNSDPSSMDCEQDCDRQHNERDADDAGVPDLIGLTTGSKAGPEEQDEDHQSAEVETKAPHGVVPPSSKINGDRHRCRSRIGQFNIHRRRSFWMSRNSAQTARESPTEPAHQQSEHRVTSPHEVLATAAPVSEQTDLRKRHDFRSVDIKPIVVCKSDKFRERRVNV